MRKRIRSEAHAGHDAGLVTRRSALTKIGKGAAIAAGPAAALAAASSASATTTPATAPLLNLKDFGALGDGSTDDTAAIKSAIAAAGSAGAIVAPAGTYAISDLVTVPPGVNLSGAGNSHTTAATTFKCTAAGAGFAIQGSGGACRDFKIDGNSVATLPLQRTYGAQRTFEAIDVVNSAEDNFHEFGAQNDTFISCNFENAARDNVCLDNGTGGLAFVRCEVNNPGRYNLRSDNAVPGGPYTNGPSNILFAKCIFERVGSSATSAAYLSHSFMVRFESCEFHGVGCSGPLIDLANGTKLISLDGGYVVGSNAETGLRVADNCEITLAGRPQFQNLSTGIALLGSASSVKLDTADIFWTNVPKLYAPSGTATVENCVTSLLTQHPIRAWNGSSSDALLQSFGTNGKYFRLESSGKWSWGPGTDQGNGDTTLYRSSTNTLSTDGTMTAAGGVRTGQNGTLAATIYSGSGAPSTSLGKAGDFYFRTDQTNRNGQRLYVKTATSWSGIV